MNQTLTSQESKKPWLTPELIVLVRSKPEEAVLQACKTFQASQCVTETVFS